MDQEPLPRGQATRLPQGVVVLLSFAAAAIILAGLHATREIAAPAFLALVLAVTVHPLRPWLISRGLPGWAAATIGLLVVYLVLVTLTLSCVVAVARFASLLPAYEDEFDNLVDGLSSGLADVGVGEEQVDSVMGSVDIERLAAYAADVLGEVFSVVSSLLFVATLLFFLSIDAASLTGRLLRTDAPLASALRSFAWGTRRYLVVSTVFGFIVAVIDTGFLWIVGVPAPLLWGVLAFITNYIPNIGFVIGLAPPAVLGLLESGPGLMLLIIAMYSLVNFVIQSIIQPKYVGDAVGLPATITFLSLVFWAWVLGPLGALLAVPLSLMVKAVLIEVDPGATLTGPPRSAEADR